MRHHPRGVDTDGGVDLRPVTVRAFRCGVRGTDWEQVVNAESMGKAKARYWYDVHEAWPDIPYIAITCKVYGPAFSSASFLLTAAARGMPDLRCGQRVLLASGLEGVVVGSNGSANFDILVSGQVGNVHPGDIVEVRA